MSPSSSGSFQTLFWFFEVWSIGKFLQALSVTAYAKCLGTMINYHFCFRNKLLVHQNIFFLILDTSREYFPVVLGIDYELEQQFLAVEYEWSDTPFLNLAPKHLSTEWKKKKEKKRTLFSYLLLCHRQPPRPCALRQQLFYYFLQTCQLTGQYSASLTWAQLGNHIKLSVNLGWHAQDALWYIRGLGTVHWGAVIFHFVACLSIGVPSLMASTWPFSPAVLLGYPFNMVVGFQEGKCGCCQPP